MAFKMKGFSAFTKKEEKVTREKSDVENLPLQEGEDPDIEPYKGDVYEEKIADIEDRIEFVENDMGDGKMTPEQRSALAALDQKLRELRRSKKKK